VNIDDLNTTTAQRRFLVTQSEPSPLLRGAHLDIYYRIFLLLLAKGASNLTNWGARGAKYFVYTASWAVREISASMKTLTS